MPYGLGLVGSVIPCAPVGLERGGVPSVAASKASVVFSLLVDNRVRVVERDVNLIRIGLVYVEGNEVGQKSPEYGRGRYLALDACSSDDVAVFDRFEFKRVGRPTLRNLAILAIFAKQDPVTVDLVAPAVSRLNMSLT